MHAYVHGDAFITTHGQVCTVYATLALAWLNMISSAVRRQLACSTGDFLPLGAQMQSWHFLHLRNVVGICNSVTEVYFVYSVPRCQSCLNCWVCCGFDSPELNANGAVSIVQQHFLAMGTFGLPCLGPPQYLPCPHCSRDQGFSRLC